ncbi:MAG: his Kinase domain protein [Deltaproteobacteria bacterium]|nr:his Kinase domain protein [Deltaproteobacteria bacterium]
MNLYFLLPLISALACLVFGVLILARDRDATPHRCAAALLLGGSWWGIGEALWTLAPDPVTALAVLRISAPGWIAVGPVCMHLFLAAEQRSTHPMRRVVPFAYAGAALFLLAEWTEPFLASGPWITEGMARVPWGYAYLTGPAYWLWYTFTVLTSSAGIFAALQDLRGGASPAETHQTPWLGTGVGIPLMIGSTTDGLLPLLGIPLPRLGVASFAVFGALVTWSMHRFGFSLLAPKTFAGQILEAMPEGVALATPEGRIRAANPSLAALLDLPVAALLDRPLQSFLPGITLTAENALRELEFDLETAQRRVPVAISAAPLRDKQGALLGLVLVVRDLREVVNLRSRLLTSARLAAVGELAAGIAHEINNPLAYIGANLRALREHWLALADAWRGDVAKLDFAELFDEGTAMLDDSLEGVERTAGIVRDVRAFSHGGADASERFDPHEVLDRALRVAAPQLRRSAQIEREYGEVPLIEGARRELEQVFLNLIVNAAQAIDGTGVVRVRTSVVDDTVEIAVADSGRGIAPEHLERIFDPFFTTKPVGEGTGLGLSISHEIVRRHGGRIDVASKLGQGTEFRVRLPIAG